VAPALGSALALALACGAKTPPPVPAQAVASPSTASAPGAKAKAVSVAFRPRFPVPGATSVCTDPTLSLTFQGAVRVGTSGFIKVFDVKAPDAPVDVIDVGAASYRDVIGGRSFELTSPVVLEDGVAHVRLRNGALKPSTTYAVTVDEGVFVDDAGRSLGALLDANTWRFTTRELPLSGTQHLVVSGDGSGHFCSVQGAFDSIPSGNSVVGVIDVKPGIYREILFVENKGGLVLIGEDRARTVIRATNNENLQNKQGSKMRALASFENVRDMTIENLTFHNTTPQGGSQAEALRIDPGEHIQIRHSNFISRQDTLLLTGSVYVLDSYVEGNVDYVWGKGTAYFERVELKTVGRPGWNVQARNPAERFGYVFVDSTLSADADVTGHLLARIDAKRFPASHVAYVDCRMAGAIDPRGWEITPPGTTETRGIRFWEFGTKDLDGKPLDAKKRHPAARLLTRAEAAKIRDKRHVFGGWDPDAK
jgi:pectin methylesterase-like acyl-CoA thioesterase